MRRQRTSRDAFTLVEMMVATALILFIMAIISAAFRSGLDTFSKLKVVGRQQEQLMNAQRIFQRDLGADHFEPGASGFLPGLQGPRLSDWRWDRVGCTPPESGYFIAWQDNVAQTEQGGLIADGEGISSTKNALCKMRFSVKLRTDAPPYDIPMYRFARPFSFPANAPIDRNTYPDSILDPINAAYGSRLYYFTSTWSQVSYFMVPTGGFTDGGAPLPLYSLRRNMVQLGTTAPSAVAANVNAHFPNAPPAPPTPVQVNRMFVPPASATGDDILLTDIVSCEFKYLWTGPNQIDFNPAMNQPGAILPGPKLPIHPLALQSPRLTQPLQSSLVLSSQAVADGADWPFSDLPLDSCRMTLPDGVTKTAKTHEAWPGSGGTRQWDESEPLPVANPAVPSYYYDSWYKVSDPAVPATAGGAFEPIWAAPPVDDRGGAGKGVNSNARVPGQPPLRIRINAVQIKLRIYDSKTGTTRQITFMQEV